ncbi:MAG: hypothetical protein QXI40_06815 [Ignisphaera sp.]|uniref:Uncharacterized protein n=1 Tax=Ignisphaera aggregans TaxID=334771 RepID=A0A7C4D1V6_9CREN
MKLVSEIMSLELELVDVYRYEGFIGKRFRFRIKGTKIYVNVLANSVEDAVEKAKQLIKQLELEKYVKSSKS